MILPRIYEKDNQRVTISDKFIYCESIYALSKGRAEMLEEKYYSLLEPLKIKNKNLKKKFKDYILFRYIDLISAPEEYLLINKFKKL